MPIQGPVVVVADQPPPDLVKALSAAGAFPVLESPAAQAAEAIAAANPSAAILIHDGGLDAATMAALEAIAYQQQPLLPIFARIATDLRFAHAGLLPLAANLDIQCLVACLQSALRVRASHAAVLGRIDILKGRGVALPDFPDTDPLEDATVLVVGRSRSYPELSTAIGNQAGLIGALSLETAARNLKSRVVDGIAIGDGFSPRMIGAFLTVLAEDSRFRDLPVAMLSNTGFDFESLLPNFSTHNDIGILVDHLMPYVRLQAFEMRI
ncbi:MAG: GGDEF domain-containing protein, partial [Pseudorhodoplanes sp.]